MTNTFSGIVWLASYPKSGNTWLRSFINNLYAVQKNGLDVEAADINKMQRLTAWDIGAKRYEKAIGKPVADASPQEIAKARAVVQAQVASEFSGVLPVKTHNMLSTVYGHPTINLSVTAGAIYIVRDPRDVAISFSHHMGVDIDTAIKVMSTPGHTPPSSEKTVGEIYGSWAENVESWTRTKNDALLFVRYEDMSAEPQKTFMKIADHLKQNATDLEVERAIELSSFKTLQKLEDKQGFTEKPKQLEKFFRSGTVGEWKDVLTPAQAESLKVINAKQMERFGYLT